MRIGLKKSKNTLSSICVFLLLITTTIIYVSCKDSPTDPEPPLPLIDQLKKIPGLQIREVAPEPEFEQSFELILQQPVDHENPEGQVFQQRIHLDHAGLDDPVVFLPSGYNSRPDYFSHLTSVLNANQIYVTHRYMGDARPVPTDWQYQLLGL